jgi:hypothetical protein
VTASLARYAAVLREIREEFPDFEVEYKDESKFMKVLDVCLKIITFGQMKTFMTSFVTTMGNVIYVPRSWDERDSTSKAVTLRHERVHMRQKRKRGMLLFGIMYLVWPLPAIFAMSRLRWEQEAYAESLRAWVEYSGPGVLEDSKYREHILNHFTSSNYFWTYPFRKKLEKWYDDLVATIRSEMAA